MRAALDPGFFSTLNFGWTPYDYQAEVMDAVLLHDKQRVCWVAGRRVGKTDTTANIALQLAVKRPGTQVAIFAPSMKQAGILSRRVKYLLEGSRFQDNVVVDNVRELRLRFGRDERGKPRDSVIFSNSLSSKARGEGADVLIVDESAFCKGEDYRNKALPFIADRPHAIVIHISTVWSEDDHFMEAYRLYQDLPHGAVFRTPTRLKPGVTEAMLEEFKASMLESEFKREYECKLVPEGGVFDRRALARCLVDHDIVDLRGLSALKPIRHHRYLVGVDWGKFRDQTVVAVVEQPTQHQHNPGRLVLLHRYPPDPESPNHYTTVLDDVLALAEHLEADRVVADQGEGAHQAEVLERELSSRFVPFRFTTASKTWLVDHARFLVEKRLVELPVEPDDVRRAFANVQPDENGYEHPNRSLKDVFDAVALALSEVRASKRPSPLALTAGGGRRRSPPKLTPTRGYSLR